MNSYHNPAIAESFQGRKLKISYHTDRARNLTNNNHAKVTNTIYGRNVDSPASSKHSQKNPGQLSMSSSMPFPTVQSALNRRIGSIPFMQSRSFLQQRHQSRMDDPSSDGVDGGLLNLGNQLDGEDLGTRLLASKNAVNVLTKVREMQDEIQDLNKQIAEENLKFKINKVMKKKELEKEMKQTTSALLNNEATPTVEIQIAKEQERNKIISSLSDSKKSIIETLANSDSTPASNLGDALKKLLEKRLQRQENEKQGEKEKQKRLLEQRKIEQKLKEEKQRLREQELLKKQKELLSTQQSFLSEDIPRKEARANFQEERDRLISEIAKVKKKQKRGRSKKNLRKLLQQRLRASDDKDVAQKAHLRLALSSNKRIINKIERLKEERRKSAALRQKQMIDKQLNELNALRILQRKRLHNLRKKNNQGRGNGSSKKSAALLQQRLKEKLPPSSPLLRLTTAERQKLLTFMDFERNSEVLKKTNDKIKAKAQKQKLKQDATKQTLKVLEEFDDYDDYDLSDGEIDEILLGLLGDGDTGGLDDFDFDYAYEDYFGDDDLDIYDVLYDDYDGGCTSPLCSPRAPAPIPKPIPRPHVPPYRPPPPHHPTYPDYVPPPKKYPGYAPPPVKPVDYYPPKHHSYKPHHGYHSVHPTKSSYHPSPYQPDYGYGTHHDPPRAPHLVPSKPTHHTTIHGENPSSFPHKYPAEPHSYAHHPLDHPPDYDLYEYDPGLKSGPEFLDEVSGIIGGTEAAGLPPHVTNHYLKDSVLHNIQHKLRSELSLGPPNHFRSHVEIGVVPHGAKTILPPQPAAFGPRRPPKHRKRTRHRRPHIPFAGSNRNENIADKKASKKVAKTVKSIQGDPDSVSFSEIMADFFTANPLPENFQKKDTTKTNKPKSRKKNNKTVFLPF